eukprot:255661_1
MYSYIPPLESLQSNVAKDVMKQKHDEEKEALSRKLKLLEMINKETMENVNDELFNGFMIFMTSIYYVGQRRRASVPMTQNYMKAVAIPYFKSEYGIQKWKETKILKHIKSKILSVDQMTKLFSNQAVTNRYSTNVLICSAESRLIWKEKKLYVEADIMSVNVLTGLSLGCPKEKRERKKRQRFLRAEQRKIHKLLVRGYVRNENSTQYEISETIYALVSYFYFTINLPPNFLCKNQHN